MRGNENLELSMILVLQHKKRKRRILVHEGYWSIKDRSNLHDYNHTRANLHWFGLIMDLIETMNPIDIVFFFFLGSANDLILEQGLVIYRLFELFICIEETIWIY